MATGNENKTLLRAGWIALALLAVFPAPSQAFVTASYMYNLSNFYGSLPFDWSRPYFDQRTGEVYVANGGNISIFNPTGMEVYTFSEGNWARSRTSRPTPTATSSPSPGRTRTTTSAGATTGATC
jgi:hypothetical protein